MEDTIEEIEEKPKKSKIIGYIILIIILLLVGGFMLLINQIGASIGPFFLAFLTILYVKSLNEKRKS